MWRRKLNLTVKLTQRELDMYHIDLPNVPHANEDRTVYKTRIL